MHTSSYTDEQLLNLVHNTIQERTEHDIYDFTGGGITLTNIYGGKQQSYKVTLFFGFNKSKNPIKHTLEIKEEFVYLWLKAIQTKLVTMKVQDTGADFNEMNRLLNEPQETAKKENRNESPIINNSKYNSKYNIIEPLQLRNELFKMRLNEVIYQCYSAIEEPDGRIKIEYDGSTGKTNMYITKKQYIRGIDNDNV